MKKFYNSSQFVSTLPIIACVFFAACGVDYRTRPNTSQLSDDSENNPLDIGVKLDKADSDSDQSIVLRLGIPRTSEGSLTVCESKKQTKSCGSDTKVLEMSAPQDAGERFIWSTLSTISPDADGAYFVVEIDGKRALGFRLVNADAPTPTPTSTKTPNASDLHPGDVTGLGPEEIKVIDLINQYHKQLGLRPCTLTKELNGFAKDNSLIQEKYRTSGHYSGRPFGGEIAFYGPTTAKDTFIGWRNSPGHDSLMRTGYTKCGVSAGTYGNSWTVSFK